MTKDNIDMVAFSVKYCTIRESLSPYSRKMIDTFINFFGTKIEKESNMYKKGEILCDLDCMSKGMDHIENEKLKADLVKLKEMINKNENYLNLYIKVQLALGIYPDDFFFNLALDYFYREIYTKVMNDNFIDEYKDENKKKHRNR